MESETWSSSPLHPHIFERLLFHKQSCKVQVLYAAITAYSDKNVQVQVHTLTTVNLLSWTTFPSSSQIDKSQVADSSQV